MSLIYAVIAINGVASKESAQCLKGELSRYPTDEYHEISEVNVIGGLYSIRLRKAPFPQEKCLVGENGIFLFADARLDYRKELIQKLELLPSAEFQFSDTELILKAYQKWNRDCIKYLEGDFSFVLYDKEKKQIWAVRDPIGFRPLFFIQKDDKFYFSSSLKGLLQLKLFHHGPNKDFWANRLLLVDCKAFVTPHENVFQVPIGQTLLVQDNKHQYSNYFEWGKATLAKSFEERILQLRQLIDDAVETRLYSDYEVGCQLSGGLDSSFITALTANKLKVNNSERTLWTVSSVATKEQQHERDERPWVSSFSKHFSNIHNRFVDFPQNVDYNEQHRELFAFMRFRRYSSFPIEKEFTEHLNQKDCKTVLTGWRGDHFISRHYNYSVNDLLLQGKWFSLFKNLRKMSDWKGGASRSILKKAIKCNLPLTNTNGLSLPYLNKEWINSIKHLIDQEAKKNKQWKMRGVKWDFEQYLPIDKQSLYYYMEDTSYLYKKPLLTLHPLSDTRIISFALNLRGSDFEVDGKDRAIFRRAMEGIVPTEIQWRKQKGFYNYREAEQMQHILKQVMKEHSSQFKSSMLADLINIDVVLETIEQFIKQPNNEPDSKMDINPVICFNLIGYLLYFAKH